MLQQRERKEMILTNENSICYSEKSGGTFLFFFLSIQVLGKLGTHNMSSPFFYSSPYIKQNNTTLPLH